jgi:hypothetical protein
MLADLVEFRDFGSGFKVAISVFSQHRQVVSIYDTFHLAMQELWLVRSA